MFTGLLDCSKWHPKLFTRSTLVIPYICVVRFDGIWYNTDLWSILALIWRESDFFGLLTCYDIDVSQIRHVMGT